MRLKKTRLAPTKRFIDRNTPVVAPRVRKINETQADIVNEELRQFHDLVAAGEVRPKDLGTPVGVVPSDIESPVPVVGSSGRTKRIVRRVLSRVLRGV